MIYINKSTGREMVRLDHTRTFFKTNFAANPEEETRFRNNNMNPYANFVIPTEEEALELQQRGWPVKSYVPQNSNEPPVYYLKGIIGKFKPKVKLIVGNEPPVDIYEESYASLDTMRFSDVNVILSPYETMNGWCYYISIMYLEQSLDDDPYAKIYAR